MLAGCRIENVVFFVNQLTRSMAFYRGTLGLDVQRQEGHDGPYAIAEAGAVTLVFIERPVTPGESPVVVFRLDGGIEDCADQLAARGVQIVVPVSEAPDGGLTLDFLDPDGNPLSLYQPPGAARRR